MQFLPQLVGRQFRPAETRNVFDSLDIGEVLRLERDPENEYDDQAIKVLYDDADGTEWFLGFIGKPVNGQINQYLDPARRDAMIEDGNIASGHEPQVTECRIYSLVDPKKPILLIEISTGFEVETEVEQSPAEGEDDEEDVFEEDDESED